MAPLSPSLSVVGEDREREPTTETVGERVRRLQAEARALARDHIRSLTAELVKVEEMAAEIAEGGDVYPAGVRELCRVLIEEIEARVHTVEAIVARTMS